MALLYADLRRPATVDAGALPWEPSPAAGVHRRRIARAGGEVARLTSLVRYAPGSRFPEHRHGGGEEYLVLSGTFSDERGDHPAGTYVRNGVGSRHSPHTDDGCVIFVKLWWMHPDETRSATVDTTDDRGWLAAPWGATFPLHDGDHDRTRLLRLDPGARLSVGRGGGVEVFVLEGDVTIDGARLGTWGWARRPGSGPFALHTDQGARLYVKDGHLDRPPPPPPPRST